MSLGSRLLPAHPRRDRSWRRLTDAVGRKAQNIKNYSSFMKSRVRAPQSNCLGFNLLDKAESLHI
jgi:hypothetical protein